MENQKMPEYETIRAAVAGEKWAVEKVVECYKDEIIMLIPPYRDFLFLPPPFSGRSLPCLL